MSKMRLTTLNLDDECTEILRKEPNKSRYVRAAIKRYPEVVKNLDELEDQYIHLRRSYDALIKAVTDAYATDDATPIVSMISAFSDETSIAIEDAYHAGALRILIRAAADRHATL